MALQGETGLWAFLFVLSKIVELGDTAFLVLRKRPIIFLHWSASPATSGEGRKKGWV